VPEAEVTRRPPRQPDDIEFVHGLHAGLAVFSRRRDQIVRIAHTRAVRREVAKLTGWAASCHVPCTEMSDIELDRFAPSSHHEGLCVVTRPRPWLSPRELSDVLVRQRGAGLALDRVRNPYNVGALLRTAAFFGLDAVLLGAPAPHPGLAPTAVRVAEGGLEHLQMARSTDLAATLARLREQGVHIVGADSHATTSGIGFPFKRPAVLVMGHEREGLVDRIKAACDTRVFVPGGGGVESLNVAVAGGILMAEMMRMQTSRNTGRGSPDPRLR
jgi:TrmH RNA methyltransferase